MSKVILKFSAKQQAHENENLLRKKRKEILFIHVHRGMGFVLYIYNIGHETLDLI